MSDQQIAFWLITMGFVEFVAIMVAIFVVFPMGEKMHTVLKAGFAVMSFGLVVQLVRSLHYLETGAYPIDHYFPLFMTKDIGASIMIFYYAYLYKREKDEGL